MISFTSLFIAILFIIAIVEGFLILYLWTASKASLHLIRVISNTITPINDWYRRVVSASWHEPKTVTETVKEQLTDEK